MLKAGLHDGAYYLAGYAVECALKACIAKKTRRGEFPDKKKADACYTHSLIDLLRLAGLETAWKERAKSDPVFMDDWKHIRNWSEQSRYQKSNAVQAQELIAAVSARKHGALTWIRQYW